MAEIMTNFRAVDMPGAVKPAVSKVAPKPVAAPAPTPVVEEPVVVVAEPTPVVVADPTPVAEPVVLSQEPSTQE